MRPPSTRTNFRAGAAVLVLALATTACSDADLLADTRRDSSTDSATSTTADPSDPESSTTVPSTVVPPASGATTSIPADGSDGSASTPPPTVTPQSDGDLEPVGAIAYVDEMGRVIVDRLDTAAIDPGVVSAPFSLGSQPSWSPDGRQLAWLSVDQSNNRLAKVELYGLRTGSGASFTPTFIPFYVAWSPTADNVGLLGGSNTEILFGFSNRQDVNVVPAADRGERYFFSWIPGRDAIVANNGDEIRIVSATDAETISVPIGNFQTPVALADGQRAIISMTDPAWGQAVAVLDLATGKATPIATHDGRVHFVMSPDESQLAVLQLPASGGGPVLNPISFQPDPPLPLPSLEMGISFIDLTTSEITPLELDGPQAMFFDPSGTRLLVYTAVDDVTNWVVIDDDRVTIRTPAFTPSPLFLQSMLPVFDQFAQSTTPWAPDGSAFVYSRDGELGPEIVVQSSRDGTDDIIGPGDAPVWSPAP